MPSEYFFMFSRICTLNIHLTYSQHTKYSQSKTTPFIGFVTGDTNISNKVDLGERFFDLFEQGILISARDILIHREKDCPSVMKIKELDNRKIVTDLLPVSSVISNTTL